jgi:hypothetical protein
MFRLLFGTRRPVSTPRVSVRPQLEILEGRTLPSGMAPMTQFVQLVQTEQKVIAQDVKLVAQDLNLQPSGQQPIQLMTGAETHTPGKPVPSALAASLAGIFSLGGLI